MSQPRSKMEKVCHLPLASISTFNYRTLDLTQIKTHNLTATKELILSSGVISTPHILQHSGIGDPTILDLLGITPLVTLPDVGKNLTDHVFVANMWRVKDGAETFEEEIRNQTLMKELLREWEEGGERGRGPYAVGPFNQAGWFRVPDESLFGGIPDPAAGKRTAHFELTIAVCVDLSIHTSQATNLALSEKNRMERHVLRFRQLGTSWLLGPSLSLLSHVRPPVYLVCIQLTNDHHDTGGSVHPTSNFPFHPPSIDPNFLASPIDLGIMRTAVRQARKFVAGAPNAFKDWVVELADPVLSSDSEMDEWIRETAITVSHRVGTSAMSPRGAGWGVVDPDLRVKGVQGLRIVDAGVLVILFSSFFLVEAGS